MTANERKHATDRFLLALVAGFIFGALWYQSILWVATGGSEGFEWILGTDLQWWRYETPLPARPVPDLAFAAAARAAMPIPPLP